MINFSNKTSLLYFCIACALIVVFYTLALSLLFRQKRVRSKKDTVIFAFSRLLFALIAVFAIVIALFYSNFSFVKEVDNQKIEFFSLFTVSGLLDLFTVVGTRAGYILLAVVAVMIAFYDILHVFKTTKPEKEDVVNLESENEVNNLEVESQVQIIELQEEVDSKPEIELKVDLKPEPKQEKKQKVEQKQESKQKAYKKTNGKKDSKPSVSWDSFGQAKKTAPKRVPSSRPMDCKAVMIPIVQEGDDTPQEILVGDEELFLKVSELEDSISLELELEDSNFDLINDEFIDELDDDIERHIDNLVTRAREDLEYRDTAYRQTMDLADDDDDMLTEIQELVDTLEIELPYNAVAEEDNLSLEEEYDFDTEKSRKNKKVASKLTPNNFADLVFSKTNDEELSKH